MTTIERKPVTTIAGRLDTTQQIVHQRIDKLQRGYLANRATQVAGLARLRRGLGKKPGSVLDILEYTEAPELVSNPSDDNPTPAETAVHHALTLYALHQQSRSKPMHQPGHRLGKSLRRLIPKDAEVTHSNPIVRRFATLGTADSLDELVHHLRGTVQLLRVNANPIPLDYGLLARQLLIWQYPDGPTRVRLIWGRDSYTFTPANRTEQQP